MAIENALAPIAQLARWFNGRPLYIRIVLAMGLGIVCGLGLGQHAAILEIPAKLILQLLGALAPPLIMIAVTHVVMTTEIPGRMAARLAFLLILNTMVAILVGLAVANVLQPGKWSASPSPAAQQSEVASPKVTPLEVVLNNVPKSLLGPLGDRQNVIGVIIIALAFGLALRRLQSLPTTFSVREVVELVYQALLIVLHWIIALVPLGVFAIVAKVIGTEGFRPLFALSMFVVAVLVGLAIQAVWYLVRIRMGSWASPAHVIRGMRDALVMAFSTASSTATMPVTYASLKDKVGLREKSASMGALVGANFNNDGTALYEAMAALFVAQMIGQELGLWQQIMVILTSVLASVGAAGIPEAGLVTMTLVFSAVQLPLEHIGLLLTIDWFLDRCRTTINVLGDVNVSCLLDGKEKPTTQ